MTEPLDLEATVAQINAARQQSHANIAVTQGHATLAADAAAAAARDRAAIQAIAQQTVSVDTTVGTRVFAGDMLIFSDTGWRSIQPMNGWTGNILVRRQGDLVTLLCTELLGTNATSIQFGELPVGFRARTRHPLPCYSTNMAVVYARAVTSVLQAERTTAPTYTREITATLPTSDAWPTSLPGTAA